MKKDKTLKIISFGICTILALLMMPTSPATEQTQIRTMDQQTNLNAHFLGGIRGGILPTIGYMINNFGEEDAINVHAILTLEGETDQGLTYSDSLDKSLIKAGWSVVRSKMFPVYGFGPITVTLDVEADNAEPIHKTAKGIQIGFRSYIFG